MVHGFLALAGSSFRDVGLASSVLLQLQLNGLRVRVSAHLGVSVTQTVLSMRQAEMREGACQPVGFKVSEDSCEPFYMAWQIKQSLKDQTNHKVGTIDLVLL